jgi:flagellar biosynthesis/type III secretory pathway protein FliH
VTDPAEAESQVELAILSAVAHGNEPNGLAVVQAALGALGRLDQEHAGVYFQIVYNALREPMRRALEALVMERQTEGKATFPPFAQQLIERGIREGKLEGMREGKLEAKRDMLLRLLTRAGIAATADDSARIQACTDSEILDRWIDNALGAKTTADVFS